MRNSSDIERKRWYSNISVEPTMFLYQFAFQLTSVIEQELYISKACMVDHKLAEEICENLRNRTDIHKEVQV